MAGYALTVKLVPQARAPPQLGMRFALFLAAALAATLGPPGARAQTADDQRILTFQFENDLFGNADRHYTQGMRAAYVPRQADVPRWAYAIANRMVDVAQLLPSWPVSTGQPEPTPRTLVGYAVAQEMFTPTDIANRAPDGTDRPYAGWLYGALSVHALYPEMGRLDSIELAVGVVGPGSLARETQTEWHQAFGWQTPEGWDTQLHPEPAVLLLLGTKRRLGDTIHFGSLEFDAHREFEMGVGNVYDFAGFGLFGRVGRHGADPFGPPRLRPSLSGFDFFDPAEHWGWYVFGGGTLRAVAHNMFLDGNTLRDSPRVDRRPLVAEAQIGAALFVQNIRIAYTHVVRTREFAGKHDPDSFGGLSVSVRF